MPLNIQIQKSHNPNKKYDAIVNGDKIISFGAAGYSDFTLHKDPARKLNYIKRHSNEDWSRSNLLSPAWLSRFFLWEKPSIEEAIKNANQKYKDVHFTFKN
jgi:hypothetical protein